MRLLTVWLYGLNHSISEDFYPIPFGALLSSPAAQSITSPPAAPAHHKARLREEPRRASVTGGNYWMAFFSSLLAENFGALEAAISMLSPV